ncbi:NUDIX hydrolase [Rothia sp. CCM 9417]|uniref:NUDIX hydrolase n=1 Tax=Rothia sp. CCM 9417 TaxID=3402657 RepID=UPI003ADDC975
MAAEDFELIDHTQRLKFRYRVGALLVRDGKLLMTSSPGAGYYWTLGGGIRVGEPSAQAVVREVAEEAGLQAQEVRLCALLENFDLPGHQKRPGYCSHELALYYRVDVAENLNITQPIDVGEKTLSGNHEYLEWVPLDSLGKYKGKKIFPEILAQDLPRHLASWPQEVIHLVAGQRPLTALEQ